VTAESLIAADAAPAPLQDFAALGAFGGRSGDRGAAALRHWSELMVDSFRLIVYNRNDTSSSPEISHAFHQHRQTARRTLSVAA